MPNCHKLWQIFNTPPGYSTTNSPIESMNKQIKESFTDYDKLSVYHIINVICSEVITYYSYHQVPISIIPIIPTAPSDKLVKKTKTIDPLNFKV